MEQRTGRYEKILDLIPDGILAVDEELQITELNPAARRLLGIAEETGLEGRPVREMMPENGFVMLRDGKRSRFSERIRLPGENRQLECSYFCDPEKAVFLCVIRDITEQIVQKELLEKYSRKVSELADSISQKHLQLVHDIAGLLGEDAVEMQTTLYELKKTVRPAGETENG